MVKKLDRQNIEVKREEPIDEEDDAELEEDLEEDSDLGLFDQDAILEENKLSAVNDVPALEELAQKLKTDWETYIKSKGLKSNNWLETLTLVSKEGIDEKLNVDDDIRRELVFYNLTLLSAREGIEKLKQHKVKINRPDDFFAEMLKSDKMMENIKRRIIDETNKIKKFEERKQKIQNVKFSKAIKDFKNKEKASFKKNTREGLEKWKAHIKSNPDDYNKINKFFEKGKNSKGKNIFNQMDNQRDGQKGFQSQKRSHKNFNKFNHSRGNFGGDGRNNGNRGGKFGGDRFGRKNGNRGGKFGGDRQFGSRGGSNQSRGRGGKMKRPGKIARMNMRNKKNSNK